MSPAGPSGRRLNGQSCWCDHRIMLTPEKFVEWMSSHTHPDPRFGYVYRNHPRSDAHSVALCRFVLEGLLDACLPLREQAARGRLVYGVNERFVWSTTGKAKTLALASKSCSCPSSCRIRVSASPR